MISKVNVIQIVKDHWGTLQDANSNPPARSKGDIFLFFILPIPITVFITFFSEAKLDKDSVAILLAAFAILTGLLFNLLVLLLSLVAREEVAEDDIIGQIAKEKKDDLLKQTFANISYSILLGILLSLTCVAGLYKRANCEWVITLSTFAVCYGGINFSLTLLMILKRIHNLLDFQIRDKTK